MDIQPYLPYIPALAAAGAWYHERKKRRASTRLTEAKADTAELDAVEKAISIWRGLAKEFQDEVEKLRNIVEALSIENDKLRIEVGELRHENEKLRFEVKALTEELKRKS